MKRVSIALVLLVFVFAHPVLAKSLPQVIDPLDQPMVETTDNLAKAVVDTTYLLGGPGRWDGTFETPGGVPDWHGWTSEDLSVSLENHWHVSDYMADQLPGHGTGNHAMYCGDETIPACDAADTVGGYGNNWLEELEWRQAVIDPEMPVTVQLTGVLNFHTEPGYDYVYLMVQRADYQDILAFWNDQGSEAFDFTTTVSPGEFIGPGGDEVRLFWRFRSDGSWSDIDCNIATRGACQIDDLAVYFNGGLVTLDDFEPGNPVNWTPSDLPGAGAFANLRDNLDSMHPCQDVNRSSQVNFVDDGVVVPGTGGTPCIDYCYGPDEWILNHDGGLMTDYDFEVYLRNQVVTAPLPWPGDMDGALLAFDMYIHEPFNHSSSGMFGFWHVRSTASPDPADLMNAPWEDRNFVFENSSGSYRRMIEPISDLLVPDRQWVQIALGVTEHGHFFGINGPNGTPSPYFDNVSMKVWDPVGPDIQVLSSKGFGDAFPAAGFLDPVDLAANSCRVDMAQSLFMGGRGDSLVAFITPLRHGAAVVEPPSLHWVMECNPVFDGVRLTAPDPTGLLRGMTEGSVAVGFGGNPIEGQWAFDLPDTGFFFPGDRLKYYITASDDLDGDIRTAAWPPDTTGVLDFSPGTPYPYNAEIRALPTLTHPVAGQFEQPSLLLVDDSRSNSVVRNTWLDALAELGFVLPGDYDILTIFHPDVFSEYATSGVLVGYETMLYSAGSFSSLDDDGPAEITNWLAFGGKKALLAGERLAGSLTRTTEGIYLATQLGVESHINPITGRNGSIWDLLVSPQPGNGVLPDSYEWRINAACPKIRWIDAIRTVGDGQTAAKLDLEGYPDGEYSGVVNVDDQTLGNRTVFLPYDLDAISGMTVGSAKNGKVFSPANSLLYYLLLWLDSELVSSADDVPGAGSVAVSAHPNPFNPSTTIAFELPRAAEVSLDIYDLQGRLVRRLLDESPYTAGGHQQVWDGRDGQGRTTSSGVYFFRFTAGDQKRVGKLTLLK